MGRQDDLPADGAASVLEACRDALLALDPEAREAPLLIGVSGGLDSMVLLEAFRRLGHPVVAAHLDHGLREGSGVDADWVAAHCARSDIPLEAGRASLPPGSGEAEAREARLAFFDDRACMRGCGAIALAHHADDQAETMLLRLARGTGPEGLGAMRSARRTRAGRTLIRPLLALTRRELAGAYQAWGLSHREDPSNLDLRYARNRVRREVMPALKEVNGEVARHLATCAGLLREASDLRQEEAGRIAKYLVTVIASGVAVVDRQSLVALPIASAREVLREVVRRLDGVPFDGAPLAACLRVARAGGAADLPGGWRVEASEEELTVCRKVGAPGPVPLLGFGAQATTPWGWAVTLAGEPSTDLPSAARVRFDAAELPPSLVWRGARPEGDRFVPWGHVRERRLRSFLNAEGVPRSVQSSLLVLASAEHVLWVVGVARSGHAPVCESRAEVWEMQATARLPV